MFLPEVRVTVVAARDWPGWLLGLAQFGRVGLFVLVVGWHRGWRWLCRGSAERQLWAVWGGYLAACFALAGGGRWLARSLDTALELTFYPGLAAA